MLNSEEKTTDDKKHTSAMLEKHVGGWAGDETTDEIIAKIRKDSSVREPLKF